MLQPTVDLNKSASKPDSNRGGDRLVPIIGHNLRRILDQRNHQLDIANRIRRIQPDPRRPDHIPIDAIALGRVQHHKDDKHHAGDASAKDARDETARLGTMTALEAPQVREEVLRGGDDGHQEAVAGEPNVIDLHRGREAFVAAVILFADEGGIEEDEVGDEVGEEAW